MNITIKAILLLTALFLLVNSAWAAEHANGKTDNLQMTQAQTLAKYDGDSAKPAAKDEQLDSRKSDFFKFAQAKIKDMNRNHVLSRERMRISKTADGSYRAEFHQIDDTSMAFEVSRSQSKTIPYVAVLSYREEIYAASCPTPAQCRQQQFTPVGFIPNRHIFSYKNGVWN
jgi:hypothetical protein